jgi:hypothetical protein
LRLLRLLRAASRQRQVRLDWIDLEECRNLRRGARREPVGVPALHTSEGVPQHVRPVRGVRGAHYAASELRNSRRGPLPWRQDSVWPARRARLRRWFLLHHRVLRASPALVVPCPRRCVRSTSSPEGFPGGALPAVRCSVSASKTWAHSATNDGSDPSRTTSCLGVTNGQPTSWPSSHRPGSRRP